MGSGYIASVIRKLYDNAIFPGKSQKPSHNQSSSDILIPGIEECGNVGFSTSEFYPGEANGLKLPVPACLAEPCRIAHPDEISELGFFLHSRPVRKRNRIQAILFPIQFPRASPQASFYSLHHFHNRAGEVWISSKIKKKRKITSPPTPSFGLPNLVFDAIQIGVGIKTLNTAHPFSNIVSHGLPLCL